MDNTNLTSMILYVTDIKRRDPTTAGETGGNDDAWELYFMLSYGRGRIRISISSLEVVATTISQNR